MTDFTHLDALSLRLSHEREYLAAAKSDGERALRTVWIAQIEKEISAEYKHLNLHPAYEVEMTNEELLAELMA